MHRSLGSLVLLAALATATTRCRCEPATPPVTALPGAEPYDAELARQIAAALARSGPTDPSRTRHREADGTATFTNRLILEASPYLRQHAHDPVDWYPWGEAAFAKAAAQHRPVFLSIGYSTCHWCHVMEDESFEDEEIATVLNRDFVAIKVDREERPDLDAVYMAAVQRMTGDGGWPLTLVLLPDKRPFFGGTYFPPRDGVRGARVGLVTLLERLHRAYQQDGGHVTAFAGELAAELGRDRAPAGGGAMPGPTEIRAAVTELTSSFDPTWGGFGGGPKFPRPEVLALLLRYHRRTGDPHTLEIVTRTLERMAAGGLYDQLGGGFHRYAVDGRWEIPHFEKMLYANAQLVAIYLEAYQVTGRADFAQVARETLDYLLRELRAPDGGFYSATDADSDGTEGAYFVWTAAQIDAVVGGERGRVVRAYFGMTPGGNFEGGNSVLWRPAAIADVAARLAMSPDAVRVAIAQARPRLLEARARRSPPFTDRKILVAWNGLAISALARGALVLDEPRYLDAARTAAGYLLARTHGTAPLRHGIVGADAAGEAFLDDYAFLEAGVLDLFEADPDPRWLREAIALQTELDAGFADPEGGYFFTTDRHENVLGRSKPDHDDALPAGNSIAASNLLRLDQATSDDRYYRRAVDTFRAFGSAVARAPTSLPMLLVALDFLLDEPKQIVLVSVDASAPAAAALLARVRTAFLPNRILLRVVESPAPRALAALCPLVDGKLALDGQPTAYVCVGTHCEQPTRDPDVLARQLAKVAPLGQAR